MTVRAATHFGVLLRGGFLCAAVLSCGAAEVPVRQGHRAAPAEQTANAAARRSAEELGVEVRYVVELGEMRSASGVGGKEIPVMLRDSARTHAHALREAAVIEADGPLARAAAERHLPVIMLDGVVTLSELPASGTLKVRASVEFAVRRDQVLRAILSGAAIALGSSPTISEHGKRVLEQGAIDGAVQVALGGADQGLMVAAR
jgi:hypothetical protein